MMIALVHDARPWSYCLVLGAVLVVATARTRWQRWVPVAGFALVVLGMEVSRFDGQPHLTDKVDATTYYWARAVTLRAVTGVVALIVAAPIGLVGAPFVGRRRAMLGGLGVIGPVGLMTLVSGATLLISLRTAAEVATTSSTAASQAIRAGVEVSGWLVAVGALLSLLISTVICYRLLRTDAGQGRDGSRASSFRARSRG